MVEPEAQDSPLETVAGAAGARAIEAFSVLGNETRLSILLALWDAFDPWADDNTVSFTGLRERLGNPDSGQFNYHLGKLEGHFVRKTDGGYELRRAGHQIVQTVLAGTGIEDRSLDPTAVEQPCYLCGGTTTVAYDDEWLFWTCTACEGLVQRDDAPVGGILAGSALEPAGLTDRTPTGVLNAAFTGVTYATPMGGVCDSCSGPMDRWLQLCDDHVEDGVCPACGWRERVTARFRCAVCKHHHTVVPWWLVVGHPAVVAFYYDRGIPLQFEDGVLFQPRIASRLQPDLDQELVSEDPLVVRVTVQRDGEALQLTLDEDLDVVEVQGPA